MPSAGEIPRGGARAAWAVWPRLESARPLGLRDPRQPWASELWFPSGPGNPDGDCFILKVQNGTSEA